MTPISPKRSSTRLIRSSLPAASPTWLDILIHMEQIARIIRCFDLCQSGVVVAVRRFHIVRTLIHHHVDIASSRRIGMQCYPIVPGPLDQALVVGRVGVDTDNHLGEVGVTEAERGVARAGPMDSAIDRIEVHRRVHRRQLRAVLHMQIDRLLTQVCEEVGLPVPLQARWVQRIEQALQNRPRDRPGKVHCRGAKGTNRFE